MRDGDEGRINSVGVCSLQWSANVPIGRLLVLSSLLANAGGHVFGVRTTLGRQRNIGRIGTSATRGSSRSPAKHEMESWKVLPLPKHVRAD